MSLFKIRLPEITDSEFCEPPDLIKMRIIIILKEVRPWITIKQIDQYLNEELRLFFEGIPFDLVKIKGLDWDTAAAVNRAQKLAIYYV